MNRSRYRIVFNRVRNQIMAVAECASSCTSGRGEHRSSGADHTTAPATSLRNLTLSVWLAMGSISLAHAQIVADPRAAANQRPTILQDSAGRPLVNIQTPSAGGVSRNAYSQFDVQSNGAVLNNSRSSNPWLARGEARTILNEVNSANPTYLNGTLTVNGSSAQVIIANPSGIKVDGGSFVNASKATLTTGKAMLDNGTLYGFDVKQGTVEVGGKGLAVIGVPYTEILSRAAVIKGGIKASPNGTVSVVTGPQVIESATGQVKAQSGTGPAPVIAIDTSALGGMYAGKIALLSTEAGVGVRNAGNLQGYPGTASQLTITSDGRLENSGQMTAGITSLSTVTGGISNSGAIKGDKAVLITSGAAFGQTGSATIQSQGSNPADVRSVLVSAKGNVNLGAGTSIKAAGDVQVWSDASTMAFNGEIQSTGGEASIVSAKGIGLQNMNVSGDTIHLETGAPFTDTSSPISISGGKLTAAHQLTAIATGDLTISNLAERGISSTSGDVALVAGKQTTIMTSVNAQGAGHIAAAGNASISGQGVIVSGTRIDSGKDLTLEAAKGALIVSTKPNADASTQQISDLRAGGDISLASYDGLLAATALNAAGQDISMLANGTVSIDQAYKKSGADSVALVSHINASKDLTIGSVHTSAPISVIGADLVAGGQATVQGNSLVLLRNGVQTTNGVSGEVKGKIKGSSVTVQGATLAVGSVDAAATNGHLQLLATSGPANIVGTGATPLNLSATKNIALHAGTQLTMSDVRANAGGNFSETSSTANISNTQNIVNANGVLSISSKTAQSHDSDLYSADTVAIFNEAGQLSFRKVAAKSLAQAGSAGPALSGNVSVESGGGMQVDDITSFTARNDLTLATAEGDITLKPQYFNSDGVAGLVLTSGQYGAGRNLTIMARKGNLNLLGRDFTTDEGRAYFNDPVVGIAVGATTVAPSWPTQAPRGSQGNRVSLYQSGNLDLIGQNINLQGSSLYASGNLSVTATGGNVTMHANKDTHKVPYYDCCTPDSYNIRWQNTSLQSGKGTSVQALNDISADGLNAYAGDKITMQTGGNLSISGKLNRDFLDQRGTGGWNNDSESLFASTIHGENGITLGALGGSLTIRGTNLEAPNGPISLQALGDVWLGATTGNRAQERMTESSHTNIIGYTSTTTRWYNNAWRDVYGDNLSGKDIQIKAGGNVVTEAAKLSATNNVTVQAGDNALYYAVLNAEEHHEDSKKSHDWIGVGLGSDRDHSTSIITTPVVTQLQSQNDILSASGGDQVLQGTKVSYGGTANFQAGVGETARADARVVLEGVKKTVATSYTRESNYVVWQKQSGQGSTIETLILPSFNGPTKPVFKGPVLTQIPAGDFKTQIEALGQKPGLGYVSDLAKRTDVKWQPVKEAFDKWDYKQSGLTPAGAAIVAVVVTYATAGSGAGWGASLVGAAEGTTAALAANAAVASLLSQAAITYINNHGDIGKTLHDMGRSETVKAALAAAVTAGVLDKLGALDSIKDLKTSTAFTDKLSFNLINAGGRALTTTAIEGGNLEDALKGALLGAAVDTAQGAAASEIKGLEGEYLAHKLAHALAGCVAGAAAGGTCQDGAIGAATGEIVAELFEGQKPSITASDADKKAYDAKVLAYSKVIAGAVSAFSGGNAQSAITTAEIAVQNNYLSKPQLLALQKELTDCKASGCNETQTNAVLDKYAKLSAQNDAALAACTTTACVESHRKVLSDAAQVSAGVMWQVASSHGNDRLIGELLGRQNQGGNLQQMLVKTQHMETAKKELDRFVKANCQNLSSAECGAKVKASQELSNKVFETLVGTFFPPAGSAMDVKDLLNASTLGEYSLAVINLAIPGRLDLLTDLARGAKKIEGPLADIWKLTGTQRGKAIESHLAATDYKDWENVGQLRNGFFPLVDFKKGDVLVSLKTIDTSQKSASWVGSMEKHIDKLADGVLVNGKPVTVALDIRVQPGGAAMADSLIAYGKKQGIKVTVSEFK